jgi:hypothetical protein
MAGTLDCRPLAPEEVLRAYPLISAVEGCSIGPGRWREIALDWLGGEGARAEHRGIMSLRSGLGYVYGIFFHRVVQDLRHGRVLEVSRVRIMEVGRSHRALGVGLQATERLARERGCAGIIVELPKPPGRPPAIPLPDLPEVEGFRLHCVCLFRPLDPPGEVIPLTPFRRPRFGL